MTPLLLAAAIVTVEPGVNCNGYQAGIQRWIHHHLRFQRYSAKWKRRHSRNLSRRIVAEARRHGLDPLVMATIAWIESDYVPHKFGSYGGNRGRRKGEAGIWQLIPWGWGQKSAAATLVGCAVPGVRARIPRFRCVAPDVAARRKRAGYFAVKELQDIYLSTYVAAHTMRASINACRKRQPTGHGWKRSPRWLPRWITLNPAVNTIELARYAHYNYGPRWYVFASYLRRLFLRYAIVRNFVCKGRKPTWKQWRDAR